MPPLESTSTPAYPPSITYGALQITHADFDPVRMAQHEALFEGGKLFEELLKADQGTFLIKRESEKSGNGGAGKAVDPRHENPTAANAVQAQSVGVDTYPLRKKYVSYKPRVAGLINFIKAGVLSSAPVIVATRKATETKKPGLFDTFLGFFRSQKTEADPAVDFYHALNADADGRGSSLLSCKSKLMRDLAVHGRAFAGIAFPQTGAENANEAKVAGGYEGIFAYLSPLEVDDWDCDADGLCMLRRHYFTLARTSPTGPKDIKTESWSFITPDGIRTYSIQWACKDGHFEKPKVEAGVDLAGFSASTIGEMPVRMIDVGIHIMELLRPSVIDQINLNADLRWTIAQNVFALVIFYTKMDVQIDPSSMALKLDENDKAQILSPGPGIVDPLFKALDRNDDESYETMMALILKSAAQASNGRQSGEAKRMDYNTFETFLMIFSEPLRAVLQWQLETISKQRGDDDILVTVQGLDNFDIESVAQILVNAAAFLALPDTDGVPTARKAILLRAWRAVMGSSATPEQLEAVVNEIAAAPASAPLEPTPTPIPKAAAA